MRSGRRPARSMPAAVPSAEPFCHRDPAAQCHRAAAYRPRPQQHAAGHAGALRAHARQGRAVAAGHRPCRHRHPADRRAPAGRAADEPRRPGPREIPGEVWKWKAESGGAIVEQLRRLGAQRRLEPRTLHHGRGAVPRRHQGLCRTLPPGPDLQGQAAGELGPAAADGGDATWKSRISRSRAISGTSNIPSTTCRTSSSPWPPRGPKPCWATPPSRCIPTTRATRRWWAACACCR